MKGKWLIAFLLSLLCACGVQEKPLEIPEEIPAEVPAEEAVPDDIPTEEQLEETNFFRENGSISASEDNRGVRIVCQWKEHQYADYGVTKVEALWLEGNTGSKWSKSVEQVGTATYRIAITAEKEIPDGVFIGDNTYVQECTYAVTNINDGPQQQFIGELPMGTDPDHCQKEVYALVEEDGQYADWLIEFREDVNILPEEMNFIAYKDMLPEGAVTFTNRLLLADGTAVYPYLYDVTASDAKVAFSFWDGESVRDVKTDWLANIDLDYEYNRWPQAARHLYVDNTSVSAEGERIIIENREYDPAVGDTVLRQKMWLTPDGMIEYAKGDPVREIREYPSPNDVYSIIEEEGVLYLQRDGEGPQKLLDTGMANAENRKERTGYVFDHWLSDTEFVYRQYYYAGVGDILLYDLSSGNSERCDIDFLFTNSHWAGDWMVLSPDTRAGEGSVMKMYNIRSGELIQPENAPERWGGSWQAANGTMLLGCGGSQEPLIIYDVLKQEVVWSQKFDISWNSGYYDVRLLDDGTIAGDLNTGEYGGFFRLATGINLEE